MNIYALFEKINSKDQFLVIPDILKTSFIKHKSDYELKNKMLLDFNIITMTSLIESLSFSVSNEAYLYNLETYNSQLSVTKEKFKFAKYNINNENEDLNKFIENNDEFIIRNNQFLEKAALYNFNILGSDALLMPFINHYNLKHNKITLNIKNTPLALKFITKEEEVFFMFEKIAKLLSKGSDINNIYISNINDSYHTEIKKLSKFYNIPVDLNITESLYDIPYIKSLFSMAYHEIINVLSNNDLLMDLYSNERNINSLQFDQNINKVINVFNKYPHSKYTEDIVLKVIKEDIKKVNIKSDVSINNAVKVISSEEIMGLSEEAKVFILNTSYESFPNISKDNDYLSDKDKELINYPTSSEINISNNKLLEEIITLKQIQYLSYSNRDNYLEYTPSDIMNKLLNNNTSFSKVNISDLNKNYADNFYKSFFSKKNSDILQTTFTGEFLLSKEERKELSNYLKKKNIKISPTQVTTYYKLPFIYYLERILGFNTFNESISLHIGNFFHSMIEVLMLLFHESKVDRSTIKGNKKFSNDDEIHEMIFDFIIYKHNYVNEDFDYGLYFDEFFDIYFHKDLTNTKEHHSEAINDDYELIVKSMFYISKHKNTIIDALKLLVELEEEIPSSELLIEREIELSNFRGNADLVKIYDDNKYSIIDYKTGTREAFDKDKIKELVDILLKNNNDEISFGSLDLLQLILYSYFFYKDKPELKLKDLAYFSFFEDKLNGITTDESFDSTLYNRGRGKGRYINEEELKEVFVKVEKLLEQTLENINSFHFPIDIRRDITTKYGMDKSYYSVYEALAFYNDNSLEGEEDED